MKPLSSRFACVAFLVVLGAATPFALAQSALLSEVRMPDTALPRAVASGPDAARPASATDAPAAPAASAPAAPAAPAAAAVTRYPDAAISPTDCGDALSEALRSDPATMPCWSNIRTVDRWNTMEIPDGGGVKGSSQFVLSRNQPSNFSFVLGNIDATDLSNDTSTHGYGGVVGVSALLDRRRWQLMFEDAAAGADYRVDGTNNGVGQNRVTVRAVGELTSRLTWQGSATNFYGSDALRLYAPLDYRKVGEAQAPIADTVAYGLHAGQITDEEEDFKMRYESSRRSNWDFAFGHTLQHYSDDGALIQTERGHIEYLHALSPNMAFGVFGTAERQDGASPCSFAGGGLRSLSTWGSHHAELNVSGAVSGADVLCGKSIVFTGDAAFSVPTSNKSSIYVAANRGLSDGVIEHTALLNSTVVGFRHAFTPAINMSLSGAGVLATDTLSQKQYTGTFSTLSLSYLINQHLVGETALRHFQVSPTQIRDNRTILTFTLWYNPKSKPKAL